MKEVKAFKCSYCDKLYINKNSCRSHEKRCYHNPITKSCVSCAFFQKALYPKAPGHSIEFSVCLKNEDISQKLKFSCIHHMYKDDKDIPVKVNEAKATCDLEMQTARNFNYRLITDAPF